MSFSLKELNCGTHVFVYPLVHVMCLCVYVSMVCQQCMLYDDMYSHDKFVEGVFIFYLILGSDVVIFIHKLCECWVFGK